MTLEVDRQRLADELAALSEFSDAPSPAVTRIAFSAVDMQARAWLKQLCRSADLQVTEDGVGNLFARWHGSEAGIPAVATGSHIDAIPNSGRYDGTVGVLGGLEAIRALRAAGFRPRRSIELVMFTSEEPTRFGIGCLGSRLLSGALSTERAASLRDRDDGTLEQVLRTAGFDLPLDAVRLKAGHYHSFVELHIEQGPLLERQGIAIGIVTDIAAPASMRVSIRGEGGHAGAVLMRERHDALPAAAEIVLAVEAAALSTGARDSVATTGVCHVFPGAVNGIPSEVKLEIDFRDTDLRRRDGMGDAIARACAAISGRRGVEIATEVLNADAPAQCDAMVLEAIAAACEAAGCPSTRLVSRAYHDSLFISRISPMGMILVPCLGGVSHRPDEYARPEDIASGVLVLAHTLAALANR